MLGALIGGIVLLVAFVLIERRADEPLVPFEAFSVHDVRIGNILTVLMGVVITTPQFFLSLYLQQVLGQSALRAGLSLLPMATVIGIGVLVSQRLIPVVGPKRLVVLGCLIAAAGLVWFARLPAESAYPTHVLLPTLVVGAGTSVTMMPAIVAATTGVDPRNAGVASGLLNTSRQIGAALGVAALVTVASMVTDRSSASGSIAVVGGYRTALLVVAVVSVATAALSLLLRGARSSSPATPSQRDQATADSG